MCLSGGFEKVPLLEVIRSSHFLDGLCVFSFFCMFVSLVRVCWIISVGGLFVCDVSSCLWCLCVLVWDGEALDFSLVVVRV